jgi:hypothetical protein
MPDTLKVKIAVRANRTWSEIQPREFVLAYIVAVAEFYSSPWETGNGNNALKAFRIAGHPVAVALGYYDKHRHTCTQDFNTERGHRNLIEIKVKWAIAIWHLTLLDGTFEQ